MNRLYWIILLAVLGMIGSGVFVFYLQKKPVPTCNVNDVIIYPDDVEPWKNPFSCPVRGQQLTVVRQPGYRTYFQCSCTK